MPAILRNVAKTDTLEIQRQKINLLASDVYSISSGGSDLSAGNIKLGDGTRTLPSLSFVSDSSLGIYKQSQKTLGFVSDDKSIFNYGTSGIVNFRDLTLQRKYISTSGLTITNFGSGYDAGNYSSIDLLGGTGSGAKANITVTAFSGSVTNVGSGYTPGSYSNIKLSGGSGSGTLVSFIVPALTGSVTTSGSGYVDATYTNVPLTNISGSGSGATATISVSQGNVVSVSITSSGTGYISGNILSASNTNLGGSGSGFQFTVSSTPGTITSFGISTYGTGYTSSNILTLPASITGVSAFLPGSISNVSTTLSTSSPNITVTSTEAASIAIGMEVNTGQGSVGLLSGNTTVINVSGTTVTLSANPSASGAATLTFATPAAQQYTITVPSTANIQVGSIVSKTSGTGVLAANTTVTSIPSSTSVVISNIPTLSGSAVLSFTPPYGSGSAFAYTISGLGQISTFSISDGGIGYSLNDVISVSPSNLISPITYTVTWQSVKKLDFNPTISSSAISVNDVLEISNATGISSASIQSGTPTGAAATYTNVQQSSTNGSGTGARFTITKTSGGSASYTLTAITDAGSGYSAGNSITLPGTALGGTSPANDVTLIVGTIISPGSGTVISKSTAGSNINFINLSISTGTIDAGAVLRKTGTTTPTFTVNTSVNRVKYYIDTGSGASLHPSLSLYKDNTYIFDISAAAAHPFYLSIHPDGNHNKITGVNTTLSTTSSTITVPDTTGILAGMEVTVTSGTGVLVPTGSNNVVTVISVDSSTSLTLSSAAYTSGSAVLQFVGAVYDGTDVLRTSSSLTIKPTATTPTLYYFCNAGIGHEDEAGLDNQEAIITIDQNNPKTFGSGFSGYVSDIDETDVIKGNINTGELSATTFTGTSATIASGTVTALTSTTGSISSLTTSSISSTSLNITASSDIDIVSPSIDIGSFISIDGTTGNFTTSGILKTTGSLNVDDALTINNGSITSLAPNDVTLVPAVGRVAKINTTTALIIPSGTSAQRPVLLAENGAIRFNTETGQYEGYSGNTSSWSSLGGVRDLDGNTYIKAEASVGANDNTLYFYNDGNNTVKLTTNELLFNTVKSIGSLNTTAPNSTTWNANTPVTLGQYLYYGFNLYEVTTAGTTGGPANPPTHTTGSQVNGTTTLLWYASYVDELTFKNTSQVNIGTTLIPTTLVVNGDLKLYDNTVSTITNDLILFPYSGKKVTISATSSLVLPSGTTSQRGIPNQGSVRYNTSLSSFEGYNGSNWTSLGGVKDVDGNTYIIPETSPGANENILYFYNNGNNTLNVTSSELRFKSIDTIVSDNNNLDINTETVTFNSLALTIDNTGSTTTKLLSSRNNLDFALSSGVTSDPLLRLNSTGDILINKSYSTGSNTFVKVLDNELKSFEIDDIKIETSELSLIKGTTEFGLVTVFDPSLHNGAKIVLVAENTTTNDKETIEYNVVCKNSDIFHTEYGNVTTGLNILNTSFDFDGSGNVRLTPTLDSNLTAGDTITVTVIKTIFKK